VRYGGAARSSLAVSGHGSRRDLRLMAMSENRETGVAARVTLSR
jgi:hypothetical protein